MYTLARLTEPPADGLNWTGAHDFREPDEPESHQGEVERWLKGEGGQSLLVDGMKF